MSSDNNKVPPPERENSPKWLKDSLANLEVENFDKLDKINKRNQSWWLFTIGICGVVLIIALFAGFILTFVTWVIHQISNCGWLDSVKLSKIESVIFSGTMGAILTTAAQKYIKS